MAPALAQMTNTFSFRRHVGWLNLPLGALLVLLQRTPAVRVAAKAGDYVAASRAGQILRAVFSAAALGALHSRAGATTFQPSSPNPVRGTVGMPLDFAFTYTGTPSPPARFQVTGTLPPGLRYSPAPVAGNILSGTPVITGTPTEAGTFNISVQGFNAEGLTNNIQQDITFVITGGTPTVPTIVTAPQSQSVAVGATVTFTVQATGSGTLSYQWTRNGVNIVGATSATLTLSNVQTSDTGDYAVVVSNAGGSAPASTAARLTVVAGSTTVAIVAQPTSQSIASGSTVVFSVAATGATSYQWRRNGDNIAGATSANLVINSATAAQAGAYTVVVGGASGPPAPSASAQLTVSPGPDFARLVNLSILTNIVAPGDKFTLGTVIGGSGTSGSKPLLVRAGGPSLSQLGVAGALADPRLDVFSGGALAASNDDWGGSTAMLAAFNQVGAFAFSPNSSKDAAVFNPATAAGAYTIDVSGVGNATGPVIAELYDASAGAAVTAGTPRLVNVSVLKQIDAGATLTAGFVVGGGAAGRTVLIRAIGPALGVAPFNVGGAMADPKLELFSGPTAVATNDNWGGDAQLTAVANSVGAFAIANAASRDAVLLVTLAPGNYTAVVSGAGGGGLALVEVYEVP